MVVNGPVGPVPEPTKNNGPESQVPGGPGGPAGPIGPGGPGQIIGAQSRTGLQNSRQS